MVKSVVKNSSSKTKLSLVSAAHVEMRKKLSIPPPFAVSSNSYSPEYPWIGQPRPAPKTWNWKSTARIALFVSAAALALGLMLFCGQRLLRLKKEPIYTPAPLADALTASNILQERKEAGVVLVPSAAELPEAEGLFGPASFGDQRQKAMTSPTLEQLLVGEDELTAWMVPKQLHPELIEKVAEQVVEISIAITLENGTLGGKTELQEPDDAISIYLNTAKQSDDLVPLVNNSTGDGDGKKSDEENLLRTSGVKSETVQGSPMSENHDAEDKKLTKSAGLISEMAEFAKIHNVQDSSLVKSAGLTSEVAEASISSYVPPNEEKNLLRSAGLVSEVVEAAEGNEYSGAEEQRTEDHSRSAGKSGEMVETQRSSIGPSRVEDPEILRSAGLTSEIVETMALAHQRRGNREKPPTHPAVLYSRDLANSIGLPSETAQPLVIVRTQGGLTPEEKDPNFLGFGGMPTSVAAMNPQSSDNVQDPTPPMPARERAARATALLARLHDLSRRQEELAGRIATFRRVQGLDPKRKEELAAIARTFKEQLLEIRKLQEEGKDLGVIAGPEYSVGEETNTEFSDWSDDGPNRVVLEVPEGAGESAAPAGRSAMRVPLMVHVLQQRQRQRDAWQQEQRGLAHLQLLDLYRKHHHQEELAEQHERAHRHALRHIGLIAGTQPNADSLKVLSDALGSPVELSLSCPNCGAPHDAAPTPIHADFHTPVILASTP